MSGAVVTARSFQQRYESLRHQVDRRLSTLVQEGPPHDLNDACRYVLLSGGKRIRSTLVMLACEAVGGRAGDALDAGAAVEIMHNFTLVHDDIMDNATSRRGRPTVHMRWDLNNALLAGDILLGIAYAVLLRTRGGSLDRLTALFTQGLLEVCEGQALDLEFERRKNVTVDEYFGMIEKKTGRLLSMAAEIGAVIGDGTPRQLEALRRFGQYIGRAFQLQDDLLDITADQQRFGKSIGGDIMERKKTFLLLTAAARARGADRRLLKSLLAPKSATFPRPVPDPARRAQTIAAVRSIYERHGVIDDARRLVHQNTAKAVDALKALPRNNATAMLRWLSEELVQRAS